MKKVEYIEKYGEEAWEKKLEKDKLYYREHYNEAKIKRKEYFKEYRQTHKEERKQYIENNKDYFIEYHKNYNTIHKEKLTAQGKEYRIRNKEKIAARKQKYRKTKMGRACELSKGYKRKDRESGLSIDNNINSKWIVDNIFSGQKCIYCGDQDWMHLGCDRIDNNKPHTPKNVVCACFICNATRTNNYTVEEFKKYRSLHPRACDIPKAPAIELSATGALKKRAIRDG